MHICSWVYLFCSMFPKSTHETFAQKMYQTYKSHKRFSKPKLSRTDFTINHYAGDVCISIPEIFLSFLFHNLLIFLLLPKQVTYQADQFLDKNKDYVVAEHQALLTESKCSFVASLFPPLPEETSKQSKFSSIGTRFKVGVISESWQSTWEYGNPTYYHVHQKYAATTTIINGNP